MPAMWAHPEVLRRGAGAGFTLLELLVVIAIMAAISAAFPLMLNKFVPARRADAAARELLADIRLAQARSTLSDASVVLIPNANGYELRDQDLKHAAFQSRQWRESTALTLRSPDGSRELTELRLYPDGSSSGGQLLIQDGQRQRRLLVSELSGRVRVAAPVAVDAT